MFQRSLIKDDHIEPLGDGVLQVLEEVGVLCQNDEMTQAMEAAGCVVDFASQRVKFPRAVMAPFVEGLRAEYAGSGWGEARPVAPGLAGVGGQVAQFYYDSDVNEARSSNRADFITLTKFGDALHRENGVGHSLSLTDVPPLLEPLEAALLLAEYAHQPNACFAWNVRQVDYLIEMGQCMGLEDWFSWGACCFAHPLRFDGDCADKFARRVREGVATGFTAMPVAGVSAPVTVEGFVVVTSAEHVATWFAARALNPKVGLAGSMWAGSIDMRTGAVSYCACDAMLYAFCTVEFLRRWTGITLPVGAGDYCDAKVPGLYTALEKAHKAMTVAAFTGAPLAGGSGLLDEGRMLSPVQILLDREYAGAAGQYGREVDPTPETIAMPTILDVGVGIGSNFFESAHTLEHFRNCLWLPRIVDRSGWNGFAHERQALDRATAQVHDLLGRYEKPEGREEQLAAMREVLDRARRELPG